MKEKDRDNPGIEEIINEKDDNLQKEKYNEYVKNMTPKNNIFLNCTKAFLVGVLSAFWEKCLARFISLWAMMINLQSFIAQ